VKRGNDVGGFVDGGGFQKSFAVLVALNRSRNLGCSFAFYRLRSVLALLIVSPRFTVSSRVR
jgi:hypothetical protein